MTNNRETWASAPGQLPHATYDLAGAVSGVGYEGAGANPSGAVAAARLSTARLRVVVSINGGKFRVPVGDRTLSIGWLCGDVAARYARHHKLPENSVTIRELRGSDGSVLDETDAVCDVADDMEELVGVISTSHHRAEESERTEVGAFARAGSGGAPISRRTSMPEPPNGAAVRTSSDVSAIRPQMMQGLQAMLGRARSGLSSTDTDAAKAMMVQQQSGAQLNEEVLWPGACMSIEDEDLDSWATESFNIKSCEGHGDGVTCLQVRSNTMASGGRDRMVRVWDVQRRTCVATLQGHSSNVRCLALARSLVVSGGEATVRVWGEAYDGRYVQTGVLEGHNHFVSGMALDEELRLVTASWDRTLRIWNVPEDGSGVQSVATLAGHTASVLSLQRRQDHAISGSLSGEVFLWNLMTEQLTLRAQAAEGMAVNALAWERNVVLAACDMDVLVLDANSGKRVVALQGHTDVVTCLVVSMPWVISGSRDASIKVWSTA